MKYYILITADIHPMGGMQSYDAAKTDYLKKSGWNVKILYPGDYKKENYAFYKNLDEYRKGGFHCLNFPPCCLGKHRSEIEAKRMTEHIGVKAGDEVIIESCTDIFAMWGEILAEMLNGKNFCFILNEKFEGEGKYYKQSLDFFSFKLERKELAFISEKSLEMLFDDSVKNLDGKNFVLNASNNVKVEDCPCEELNVVDQNKITIGYFGRYNKGYLPFICNQVFSYAKKNNENEYNFLLVGDGESEEVDECLKKPPSNLKIIRTHGFSPIPKKLFDITDVFIASSGCASIAFMNGAKVIVSDIRTGKAEGVLGYTARKTMFNENVYDYEKLLDEVLRDKQYDYEPPFMLPCLDPEESYKEHFEFIANSDQTHKYYDVFGVKNIKPEKRIRVFVFKIFGSGTYICLRKIKRKLFLAQIFLTERRLKYGSK